MIIGWFCLSSHWEGLAKKRAIICVHIIKQGIGGGCDTDLKDYNDHIEYRNWDKLKQQEEWHPIPGISAVDTSVPK